MVCSSYRNFSTQQKIFLKFLSFCLKLKKKKSPERIKFLTLHSFSITKYFARRIHDFWLI